MYGFCAVVVSIVIGDKRGGCFVGAHAVRQEKQIYTDFVR